MILFNACCLRQLSELTNSKFNAGYNASGNLGMNKGSIGSVL